MSVDVEPKPKRAQREALGLPLLTDPAPARAMLAALAEAKRRGERFEAGWARGLQGVTGQWRVALIATRPEWEACWSNQQSLGGSVREFLAA